MTGFLAHSVMVCAQGGNIELLLNRITGLGITPKEVVPVKTGMVFSIPARHFKYMRAARKGTGCELFLVRKAGPLFLFKRIYRRWSLPIAGIIFFILLHLLSGIVWRIDTGALSEQNSAAVKALLFAEGVYPGSIANSEQFKLAEQNILINSDTFAYLKLNFSSGRLQVSTKLPDPYSPVENSNTQLVAAFDGIIKFIEVYEGYSVVKLNQSVSEGQLLVDNVKLTIDNDIVTSQVHANIIGYGEVEYTHIEPKTFQSNLLTNEFSNLYTLHLLNFNIPLYIDAKFDDTYHRITTIKPVSFLGLKLPLTIETTTLTKTQPQQITITAEEAKHKAQTHLEWQLREEYHYPVILSTQLDIVETEEDIITKARYTFLANIIKNQ